jgi:hypothetical protein
MSKAEGDPRKRDVAAGGRDAASPSQAESPNVKSANATVQEDIPPVHVLEAAQNQDRKETEDLLAGFDRPGRSPKPVSKSKERDFVDYYARKKPGSADSGGGRAALPVNAVMESRPPRQGDVSTVIVHRKGETPAWLGWAVAALAMLLVGGAVAYIATSDGRPSAHEPTAPSAATTITSAMSAPSVVQGNPETNIPPPDPAMAAPVEAAPSVVVATTTATTLAAPAKSAGKRDGRTVPSAAAGATTTGAAGATGATAAPRATNATDDSKPPPRDDFIRDL